MSSLIYLFAASLKNHLLELRKRPGMIALYAFVILALSATFVMSIKADMTDMRLDNAVAVLEAGAFAVIGFFVLSYISKGLDTGGSFFSMADVGLLFVSPVSPSQILTYGMLKQAGTALVGGIVIIAQAANFRNFFGIGPAGTLVIFTGYALSLIASESTAVAIYSLTNSRPKAKLAVQAATVAAMLPLAAMAVFGVVRNGLWPGLIDAATCVYARIIPVAGWTAAGISAFMSGNAAFGLVCYLGNVALFLGAVALMRRHGSDYYEDVLAATESSDAIKAAASSGDTSARYAARRKVKVHAGDLSGYGASAIMGRQLRESFRLNRFKLLDGYSFAIIALAVFMAYSNRSVGGISALLVTFFVTIYMQMSFMTITGPLKELTCHYIFLIPEKPLAKLFWNNGACALKALCESVFVYLAAGIVLGLAPTTVLAAIVANFCFCLMLFALNVWGLRFFRATINRGILLVVYLFIAIFALIPGVAAAAFTAYAYPGMSADMVMPATVLSLWELFMAFMFTYWSRNVLHNIDMIKIEIKK